MKGIGTWINALGFMGLTGPMPLYHFVRFMNIQKYAFGPSPYGGVLSHGGTPQIIIHF